MGAGQRPQYRRLGRTLPDGCLVHRPLVAPPRLQDPAPHGEACPLAFRREGPRRSDHDGVSGPSRTGADRRIIPGAVMRKTAMSALPSSSPASRVAAKSVGDDSMAGTTRQRKQEQTIRILDAEALGDRAAWLELWDEWPDRE